MCEMRRSNGANQSQHDSAGGWFFCLPSPYVCVSLIEEGGGKLGGGGGGGGVMDRGNDH